MHINLGIPSDYLLYIVFNILQHELGIEAFWKNAQRNSSSAEQLEGGQGISSKFNSGGKAFFLTVDAFVDSMLGTIFVVR